jgi:hypothetical protein
MKIKEYLLMIVLIASKAEIIYESSVKCELVVTPEQKCFMITCSGYLLKRLWKSSRLAVAATTLAEL